MCWGDLMLFLTRLQENCSALAGKIAIEYVLPEGTETVSYGQLEARVQQTMAYLQSLGVQPGDRVALQLPKCFPFHLPAPGDHAPGGSHAAA